MKWSGCFVREKSLLACSFVHTDNLPSRDYDKNVNFIILFWGYNRWVWFFLEQQQQLRSYYVGIL